MAEVSIKVLIAGRTYPLTVKQEEEQMVMDKAKMITDKVKEMEQNYAIRDKQDLLAMTALNLLVAQRTPLGSRLSWKKKLTNSIYLFRPTFKRKACPSEFTLCSHSMVNKNFLFRFCSAPQ